MMNKKEIRLVFYVVVLLSLLSGVGFWVQVESHPKVDSNAEIDAVPVVSTVINRRDVPVRVATSGVVTAKQRIDVRAQISATVGVVHIEEGQYVQKGERLFTLDSRAAKADHNKAKAQLAKSHADLVNAERQLERYRELFEQGFISQAALDMRLSQVDSLRGQLGVDQAAVDAKQVAHSFTEIIAPISGRTGAIPVHPGSLVTPSDAAALVSITQVDPILVSFTLPEREFNTVQQALEKGNVPVRASAGETVQQGFLTFIDNAIDTASGTIRIKAEFPNPDNKLWPGMYVKVILAPRILRDVFTVPTQAVQTGVETSFLYVIEKVGKNYQVAPRSIQVRLIQDGLAVIEGKNIATGKQIVLEGAQNLRPGSLVDMSSVRESETYTGDQIKNQSGHEPGRLDSIKHAFAIGGQ